MKKYLILLIIITMPSLMIIAQEKSEIKDEAAIKKTALDYADGFYDGDGDRMERAIHADLNKVFAVTLPQTGKTFLQYSTVSQLVEMSRAKTGYLNLDKRNLNVTVLLIKNDVACVKITSAIFNDYLQMINFDGQWKIVNVLWTLGPDVPNRPPLVGFNPADEKLSVESTVKEFYEGSFTGNVEKLEKVIHPEVSFAQLSNGSQTGQYILSRNGASIIVEVARAKLRVVPEDQQQVNINILDIMDEMAFVEAITQSSTSYFQLQQIDGRWNIINCLSIPSSIAH